MRLALRELRRNARRFVPTTVALALLVVLLLLLGGLLDGLYRGSTGALRAQQSDLVVFSTASRDSAIRSRIDPALRAQVRAVPGVEATHGLGFALVGARVPGESDVAAVAVAGYQGAVDGVPPPPRPGTGWADDSLKAQGVDVGDRLLLGPRRIPVTVRGFVQDVSYLLQGGLWVSPATWRTVLNESRPGAAVGAGTFQVLTVRTAPGESPSDVARRIERATNGTTSVLTRDEAIRALPGIKEQDSTFTQIIWITFLVSALVVALFFALLTLERVGLFAMLKAIGASASQLVVGLATQAVVVSVAAFVAGGVLTLMLSLVIPAQVPLQLTASRAVYVAIGILVMALLGSAISLRRIVRVDPASVIGAAT